MGTALDFALAAVWIHDHPLGAQSLWPPGTLDTAARDGRRVMLEVLAFRPANPAMPGWGAVAGTDEAPAMRQKQAGGRSGRDASQPPAVVLHSTLHQQLGTISPHSTSNVHLCSPTLRDWSLLFSNRAGILMAAIGVPQLTIWARRLVPTVDVDKRAPARRRKMSANIGSSPTTKESGLRKVVAASMAGTVVEWYEFFLYATAVTLVFGKMFFPNSGPSSTRSWPGS